MKVIKIVEMNGKRHQRDSHTMIVKRHQTLNEERETRSNNHPGTKYLLRTQNIKISLRSLGKGTS